MKRRRKSLTGPPLPTIGRSAETAQSRSAWSRTESRTCAGVTSAAARPAGAHLLLQAREQRGDVRPLLGHGASLGRGRYGAVSTVFRLALQIDSRWLLRPKPGERRAAEADTDGTAAAGRRPPRAHPPAGGHSLAFLRSGDLRSGGDPVPRMGCAVVRYVVSGDRSARAVPFRRHYRPGYCNGRCCTSGKALCGRRSGTTNGWGGCSAWPSQASSSCQSPPLPAAGSQMPRRPGSYACSL